MAVERVRARDRQTNAHPMGTGERGNSRFELTETLICTSLLLRDQSCRAVAKNRGALPPEVGIAIHLQSLLESDLMCSKTAYPESCS